MQLRRVVVTGVGAVSPLGNNVFSLIQGIEDGRNCTRFMPGWDKYNGLRSLVGAPAELKNENLIPRQSRRSMSKMSIFAVQAAEEALADSGVDRSLVSSGRLGAIIGSTTGSAQSLSEAFEIILLKNDLSLLNSTKFFQCVSHTAVMNVAQYLGIKGYVMATSAACASALQAVGAAYDLIRLGKQDVILCGGAEELHPTVTGSFDVIFAASTKYNNNPRMTPRPFDRDRDGLVCGEGSGILVLEDYEQAIKRKASIYCEIIGYNTCGSGSNVSQSSKASIVSCISGALDCAAIEPKNVDYINAHATATIQGDKEEAEAIRDIFGDAVPLSSLKGYIGHTLGASGAIELIASLLMMKKRVIYPTLNLENVSDDCQGIGHVMKPTKKDINIILKNCFAFGGINAALVAKRISVNYTERTGHDGPRDN